MNLLGQFLQVKVKLCEANQCADKLALKGLHLTQDFVVHGSPPVDISILLLYVKF